jgi:hypothetical protein
MPVAPSLLAFAYLTILYVIIFLVTLPRGQQRPSTQGTEILFALKERQTIIRLGISQPPCVSISDTI